MEITGTIPKPKAMFWELPGYSKAPDLDRAMNSDTFETVNWYPAEEWINIFRSNPIILPWGEVSTAIDESFGSQKKLFKRDFFERFYERLKNGDSLPEGLLENLEELSLEKTTYPIKCAGLYALVASVRDIATKEKQLFSRDYSPREDRDMIADIRKISRVLGSSPSYSRIIGLSKGERKFPSQLLEPGQKYDWLTIEG